MWRRRPVWGCLLLGRGWREKNEGWVRGDLQGFEHIFYSFDLVDSLFFCLLPSWHSFTDAHLSLLLLNTE